MQRLLFGYLELYQHYLPGAGLYVTNSTGSENMYYILTDYQGNWNKVIAEDGNTVEEYNFDPWGNRRNANNWSYNNLPVGYLFDRGYTGHEHLDPFGLINMNGRVYDPFVARFLSPDNFVQTPFNSQGFNRYSYGFNNPLLYTDPDGELPIVAAAIYVVMQGIIQGDMARRNGDSFGEGFAWGAGTAGVSMGVGAVIGPISSNLGFFSAATNAMVPAAIGGTITYGLQSLVYGSPFNWQGLAWGIGQASLMGGVEGLYAANTYNNNFIGPLQNGQKSPINNWWGTESAYNRSRWSLINSDNPDVYFSPVGDNYGIQDGECALRCFEEFSKSYGYDKYNYDYWYKQNGSKLGLLDTDIGRMVNSTGVFFSEEISNSDPYAIPSAFIKNKRVMMGYYPEKGGAHAVMVNKVKVWPSGHVKVYLSETSPMRVAPYSTFSTIESRFWTFYISK